MDADVVRAAEREMRRPAPEGPHSQPQKKRRPNERAESQSCNRYSYSALDDLSAGTKGFVLTCGFRREKSAIHEAMAMLGSFLPLEVKSQVEEDGTGPACAATIEDKPNSKANDASTPNDSCDRGNSSKVNKPVAFRLAPVKLSCSGLVLLASRSWDMLGHECQPTEVVKRVMNEIAEKKRERMKFCQRIIPVEHLGPLQKQSLYEGVQKVVQDCDGDASHGPKFAVAYHASSHAAYSNQSGGNKDQEEEVLDRKGVISVIASSFVEALRKCTTAPKVDLKDPKVLLLCYAIPTARQTIACLCLLEEGLFTTRPQMNIKSIAS
eukprot:evm.model.scf_526.2 EVM.evm.TU.scf_526.2   scf_526:39027-42532(+)